MKIAVTCENGEIFQHFGHTPEFALYTVEQGRILAKEVISCGDTGHGALAGLLRQSGVDLLICGGIGSGARTALAQAGIELIGGASGKTDEAVSAYVQGTLSVNADFLCHAHDHEAGHSCASHSCSGGGCHSRK